MIMEKCPVLYSYRRCPYAMRARMAIFIADIAVEQREIVFWDKPQAMLQASPKGTVPVLVLPNNTVVDESRDILFWAFKHANKNTDKNAIYQAWLFAENSPERQTLIAWIDRCDNDFKVHLDHYKYADRFPEFTQDDYRERGCRFLNEIESSLSKTQQENNQITGSVALIGKQWSAADIAIFPFVRQFVHVDKSWFEQAPYPYLKAWLHALLNAPFFKGVMKNRPVWQESHNALWVNEPGLVNKNEFTAKATGMI